VRVRRRRYTTGMRAAEICKLLDRANAIRAELRVPPGTPVPHIRQQVGVTRRRWWNGRLRIMTLERQAASLVNLGLEKYRK
jgi:hypothetical protein